MTLRTNLILLWAVALVTGCKPYTPEPYVETPALTWGNLYIKLLADPYARKTWDTVTEAQEDTILFRIHDSLLTITDNPSSDSVDYHETVNLETTKRAVKEIFAEVLDERKHWDYVWFNFLVTTKTPQGKDTSILFKNSLKRSFFHR